MYFNLRRINRSSFRCKVYTVLCIILNVSLAYLAYSVGMPLYLDTIGTIVMASMGGFLPGIIVAVVTNLLCSIFNHQALYYSLINVLVAMMTAWFVSRGAFKKKLNPVIYFIGILLISGLYGGCVQWLMLGGPQFTGAADLAHRINFKTGIGYFLSTLIVNIAYNVLDKATTSLIALFILRMIPEKERKAIRDSSWKQMPIDDDKLHVRTKGLKEKSIQRKMGSMLTLAGLILILIIVWISISIFYGNMKNEYTQNARNAARFTANVVDGDRIDEFINYGTEAEDYVRTDKLLYRIRESCTGVKFLYVVKPEEDGLRFAFDLYSDDRKAAEPGEKRGYDEDIQPYIPELLEGKDIAPFEAEGVLGRMMRSYYPIKDSNGDTVGYSCAEVPLAILSDYAKEFLMKTFLIFSGFFVLILGYGIWTSGFYLVYPISSMTRCVKEFIKSERDQKSLDENVKKIRSIDIHTGDDVEELYKAICEMEAEMANQMRDLRHYSDATAKMQNGLIITMADMVENRDSDTGSHIQKTAAYVKIIAEGLRKKGYYAEKISPQYITDIVASAPLHDIGKINISDTVLNKPGKLTPEEFEIMKTHTTAGMQIIEKAINTTKGESYLKEARNMAAYHHERWDGKGYPEGLHGQVIPLSARIMAVADVFDALVSPRVYKSAFSFERAIEIIREGSGTQFDPKCVEVFLDSLTDVRIVLKTYQGM